MSSFGAKFGTARFGQSRFGILGIKSPLFTVKYHGYHSKDNLFSNKSITKHKDLFDLHNSDYKKKLTS